MRARLVLVSIMEGSWKRARVELDDFAHGHPAARGTIGGREGLYVDLLERLLAASQAVSRDALAAGGRPASDWTTFAGSPERTAHAAVEPILRGPAWEIPLLKGDPYKADASNGTFTLPQHRAADDAQRLLSFHPLVAGNLVLFNTLDKVFAFDLTTGKPAWPVPPEIKDREPGEVYSGATGLEAAETAAESGNVFHALGVPRFTMTVAGRRLFARLGSPITDRPLESGYTTPYTYLVCLDLAAQGRLDVAVSPTGQRRRTLGLRGRAALGR